MVNPGHLRCMLVIGTTLAGLGCATGRPSRAVTPVPTSPAWQASQPTANTAICHAHVKGHGLVNVERDYLPHVINCENGGADYEALKAQAVAARSYLFHIMGQKKSIADGTSDQVYSCGRLPTQQHYRAVEETAGQILRYRGTTVAAFYVAGAAQTPPTCMDMGRDRSNTERFVTYNGQLAGEGIEQSRLGWVNGRNHANRGAMSQRGSHCLARLGWSYDAVLRYYYGRDIQIAQTHGACVPPRAPATPAPPEQPRPQPPVETQVVVATAARPAPSPGATPAARPGPSMPPSDFDPSHAPVGPSETPSA